MLNPGGIHALSSGSGIFSSISAVILAVRSVVEMEKRSSVAYVTLRVRDSFPSKS